MSMPSPDEALAEMNLMMLLRHYNHLLTWQRMAASSWVRAHITKIYEVKWEDLMVTLLKKPEFGKVLS